MQPLPRNEAIQMILEGMAVTGQSFEYLSSMEGSGITDRFPGGKFTEQMHTIKQLAIETTLGYNELIGRLGSIPVRLGFGTGEETTAEIVELTDYEDGRWHYKYKVNGKIADALQSNTSEGIALAFWASVIPMSEESEAQQL